MKTIPAAYIRGELLCRASDVYVAMDYATEKERHRCMQLIQDAVGDALIRGVTGDTGTSVYTAFDVAEILLQVAADVSGENAE